MSIYIYIHIYVYIGIYICNIYDRVLVMVCHMQEEIVVYFKNVLSVQVVQISLNSIVVFEI